MRRGKPELSKWDGKHRPCSTRQKQAERSREHRNSNVFHPAVLSAGRHWSQGLQQAPKALSVWQKIRKNRQFSSFRLISKLNFMHRYDKSLIGARCVALPHGKLPKPLVWGVVERFRKRNGLKPNVWVYIRTTPGPNPRRGPVKKPKIPTKKAEKRGVYVQDGTLVYAEPRFESCQVEMAQRMEALMKRGLTKIQIQLCISPIVFTCKEVKKVDNLLKKPIFGSDLIKAIRKAMRRKYL